jgi:hypothetical protein
LAGLIHPGQGDVEAVVVVADAIAPLGHVVGDARAPTLPVDDAGRLPIGRPLLRAQVEPAQHRQEVVVVVVEGSVPVRPSARAAGMSGGTTG